MQTFLGVSYYNQQGTQNPHKCVMRNEFEYRNSDIQIQIYKNKYKYTNTNIQIYKYKYKYTNESEI